MANADGSIVIDTKLDNSGFQSGSRKMESAINGLQSSVLKNLKLDQVAISVIKKEKKKTN